MLLNEGEIQFSFKADNVNNRQGLVSKDSANYDSGGHFLAYLESGRLKIRLQSTSNTYSLESGNLSTDQWYDARFAFGPNGMELYVDNVLVDTNSYSGGLGSSSGGSGNFEPVVLGGNSWGSDDLSPTPVIDLFSGQLRDIYFVPPVVETTQNPITLLDGEYIFAKKPYQVIDHTEDMLLDAAELQFSFKAFDVQRKQGLVSKDSEFRDTGGHLLAVIENGRLSIRLQSTDADYFVESGELSPNQWYDVRFVFGPEGMELYVDEVLVDTNPYSGGLFTTSGGIGNYNPVVLGANSWEADDLVPTPLIDFFDGYLRDVRLVPIGHDCLSFQDALDGQIEDEYQGLRTQAVAAILNAAHPNIFYKYTETDIITMVQEAFADPSLIDATIALLQEQNGQNGDITDGIDPNSEDLPVSFGEDVEGLLQENGQFSLFIKPAGVASRLNKSVTLDSGPSFLEGDDLPLPFHRLVGDFDGSNLVDESDRDLLLSRFGATPGSPEYDPAFELNNDAIIDELDEEILDFFFGITIDEFQPNLAGFVVTGDASNPFETNAFNTDAYFLGLAADPSGLQSFTVTLDGSAPVNLLNRIDPVAQRFAISLMELASLAGVPLSEGDHTVLMSATDNRGNSVEDVEVTFAIDTTAPTIPTQPVILLEGGETLTEGTINSSYFILRTIGETDSIIRLFRDGIEIGNGIAQSPVDFAVNLSLLDDGTYTFTSTAEDYTGNVSEASAPLTITIDTTAPEISSFDLTPATDTGVIGDKITDLDLVDLVGVTEPFAALRLDPLGLVTAADADGNFSFSGIQLEFGTNSLTLEATDPYTNLSSTSLILVRPILESTAPQVGINLTNDNGRSIADGITNDATVNGSVADGNEVTKLWVSVDGSEAIDLAGNLVVIPPGDGSYSAIYTLTPADLEIALGSSLSDGEHIVSISAEDLYGNRSEPKEISFNLDTVAPATPIQPDLVDLDDTGEDFTDNKTKSTSVTVMVAGEPESTVEVRVDGNTVKTLTIPSPDGSVLMQLVSVPVIVTGLSEGTFLIDVVSTDVAGNTSSASTSLEIEVDTTSPETLTLEIVDSGSVVALNGTTEPDAVVELYRTLSNQVPALTVRADGDGNYTFPSVSVKNGANLFRLAAIDEVGNRTEIVETFVGSVPDEMAPEITMELLRDTGEFNDDLLTNDPTIVGMINEASRIKAFSVRVNGSPFMSSLGSVDEGSFTLTRSLLQVVSGKPLEDGTITVDVVAADDKGNVSEETSFTFTFDGTRPENPQPLTLSTQSDTGESPEDGITNADVLSFATSTPDLDSEVVLFAEGVEIARETGGGPVSFNVALPEGRFRLVAQAIDAAGNFSFFTAPVFVTVDRTLVDPEVSLATASANFNFGPDNHTTQQFITLTGKSEPVAQVEIVDSTQVGFVNAAGNFILSGIEVQPGDNLFTILTTDQAGNQKSIDLTVTMHDVDAPVATLTLQNDTGLDDGDLRTFDPTVRAVVTDASPLTAMEASLNGGDFVSIIDLLQDDLVILDNAVLEQLNGNQTLADGRYKLQIRSTDSFANTSSGFLVFDLDRTTPPLNVIPDLLTGSDNGNSEFDNLTNFNTPGLRLFAERGAKVTFYGNSEMIGEAFSTGVAMVTTTPLFDGVYQITATIEDQAGNLSGSTDPLTLTIDTAAPSEPFFSIADEQQSLVGGENYTVSETVTIHGFTDAGVTVELAGTKFSTTAEVDGTFTIAGIPLEVGFNTLTAIAKDDAGNTSSFSRQMTRGQPLPPEIDAAVDPLSTLQTPAVEGTILSESPISSLTAKIDSAETTVNVLTNLVGENFSFTTDELERINGGPLSFGTHKLYLVAMDSDGRTSEETVVEFVFNDQPLGEIQTETNFNDSTGLYEYSFTVSGPAGDDWSLDAFVVPVPAGATIDQIVTPTGWTASYVSGDIQIEFSAESGSSLLTGEQGTFSFATEVPPGLTTVTVTTSNSQTGEQIDQAIDTAAPAEQNQSAIDDFYVQDEDSSLVVAASAGLLANDIGTGFNVISTDAVSAWGVLVQVNSDGSFIYQPGGRFQGLSEGESVVDSFSYTVSDGTEDSTAIVAITVTGANDSPVPTNDTADPSQPSLYLRAGESRSYDPVLFVNNDRDLDVNDQITLIEVNPSREN